jgi:hypothetical protein
MKSRFSLPSVTVRIELTADDGKNAILMAIVSRNSALCCGFVGSLVRIEPTTARLRKSAILMAVVSRNSALTCAFVEPPVRIELTTARLQGECSTTELRRRRPRTRGALRPRQPIGWVFPPRKTHAKSPSSCAGRAGLRAAGSDRRGWSTGGPAQSGWPRCRAAHRSSAPGLPTPG